MKTTYCGNFHKNLSGFSLVEVVLAIGIVAIGLVAILGLFPQGLKSARNAADDSLVALLAQDTIAQRKIYIQKNPTQVGVADLNQPYYFLPDGREVMITNPPDATPAMFRCEVTTTVDPDIPNLEITQVRVVWPWFKSDTTSYAPLNTNFFTTKITAYEK